MRLIYKILYPAYQLYCFIFRPKTFGVTCIIECKGEILMIRNSYGKNTWTFPGGGIKKNETSEEAAKREVLEEVGIRIKNVQQIGEFKSELEYKKDTVFCFSAKVNDKNFVIQESEISEAKWFSGENIPKNISQKAVKVIEFWKK